MPPRIQRGKPPKQKFTEHTYKKAKPFLMKDFGMRCAYSQQHTQRGLGQTTMEIDHFDPTLSGYARHHYTNLFLATRHCNGKKTNNWPSKQARRQGVRFLNPCREQDYGVHIFENPVTHELVGATPAGRYHIRMCDLNADHFVIERTERAAIHALLYELPVTVRASLFPIPEDALRLLRGQLEKMIPMIPYLVE